MPYRVERLYNIHTACYIGKAGTGTKKSTFLKGSIPESTTNFGRLCRQTITAAHCMGWQYLRSMVRPRGNTRGRQAHHDVM